MHVTPNLVEVLIHCHCSPDPHPRAHAPAVIDALVFLRGHDLIAADEEGRAGSYTTTARGRLWLAAMLKTPIPD